jgi:virulence-associated protein VapD
LKETFSPTLRYATLRVIIALAALLGVVIHQLDVKTAFLNGILTTRVYVEQPTGFEQGNRKKKVWRLKKALYGLVEAPRLWYETLNKVLTKFGFTRITGDPCLYVLHRDIHIILLGVFVDDFLICGTSEALVQDVKNMLKARFKTKDLGPARWILGMKLEQRQTEYVLDQSQYLKELIRRFDEYLHKGRRELRTPLPTKMDVRRAKEGAEVVDLPYRELLGSIGHLAIGTRLDISFAVSLLSRFVSRPEMKDWKAAIHVLEYLQDKNDLALSYPRSRTAHKFDPNLLQSNGDVNGAVDSDFANDPDTSKPVGGYVVRLGQTAVSWRSKLLPLVTTSTCHAEYIAAFECAREVVWLRMLIKEIGFNIMEPSVVLEDNAAAKMTAESIGISDANKHVKVKFHWLREQIRDKQIRLTTVPSKDNPSDALTKAATIEMLQVMTEWSGMRSCETQLGQGG